MKRTRQYTMETYDKHGRLQKIECLRTLSVSEFMYEVERSKLPKAIVQMDTGPAYPAGTFTGKNGDFEAVA